MRVALISPVGDIGGGERVLVELARGLSDQGHSHHTFCLRPGRWTDSGWIDGAEKISAFVPGYRMRFPWTVWRACRWLRNELIKFNPDIIHANHGSWWIAASASRSIVVKSVWHLHDYPGHFDPQNWLGMRSPPSATIFTTKHVAEGFPALAKRKHAVIPPITLDAVAYRALPSADSILEKNGLQPGKYLLTVCRWQPHKGLHYWIAAVREWMARGDIPADLRFVVVGQAANSAERDYERKCVDQVAAASLSDKFVFLRTCGDAGLRSLYKHAVALVHPAVSEGFGLVLLEAMAVGLPVIASAAAGPSEVLDDGRYGVLTPVRSAEGLAEAAQRIVGNPQLRSKLSMRSKARASHFDRRQMVDRTLAVYQELLSCTT